MHFPPFSAFPHSSLLSPMLSQNTLSLCLVLSLSAQGSWIYQVKLENTDSDRGNVDRVTSHALTCPFFQRSILCKPQVKNLSLQFQPSFVSFVYCLLVKAKGWMKRIYRKKIQENHTQFPNTQRTPRKPFHVKSNFPGLNHKTAL